MTEPKACPFCGNGELELGYAHPQWVRVVCKKCKAAGPGDISEEAAIEKWNAQAEIERLEKEADWLACALCHVCKNNRCEDCVLDPDNGDACPGMNRENWRQAARRSVEANNESYCRTT